jgi:hypothetical protein
MKKLLVLAMVAFAFLACNEGASVPSKDKKAAKAVTSQAFDLLGSDAATVDKALTDAGYVELKESNMNGVVVRALKKVRKDIKAESSAQVYIYNLPQDYEKMTEEESTEYVKGLMDKGECLYVVVVRYSNDKMAILSTRVLAPLKDNINLLFTEVSDEEYKKMPEGISVEGKKMQHWAGYTFSGDEDKEFTDHAELVAAVAKAKAIEVEEEAYSVTKVNLTSGEPEGIAYYNVWSNPDEEEQESMLKENGFVAAVGSFTVCYLSNQ